MDDKIAVMKSFKVEDEYGDYESPINIYHTLNPVFSEEIDIGQNFEVNSQIFQDEEFPELRELCTFKTVMQQREDQDLGIMANNHEHDEFAMFAKGFPDGLDMLDGPDPFNLNNGSGMSLNRRDTVSLFDSTQGLIMNGYPQVLYEPSGSVQQPNEIICFQNYPGDFDFEVLPATSTEGNKLRYHYGTHKLFCRAGTHDFHFKMGFESIPNISDMTVRACIVYTDPHHKDKAVIKCMTCITTGQAGILPDDENVEHILRAPKEDRHVRYSKSDETGRYYTWISLHKPEPGTKHFVQAYTFTCMSSCKAGINRRASAIIFTLFDGNNEVRGRKIINLKVCSCPLRDYLLEFDKQPQLDAKMYSKQKKVRKFSSKKYLKKQKLDEEPVTLPIVELQQPIAVIERSPCVNRQDVETFDNRNSQEQSSSQETVYTDSEDTKKSVRLRQLMQDSKAVLKMRNSPRPTCQNIAKILLTTLKTAQELCRMAKSADEAPEDKDM